MDSLLGLGRFQASYSQLLIDPSDVLWKPPKPGGPTLARETGYLAQKCSCMICEENIIDCFKDAMLRVLIVRCCKPL